MTRNILIPTDFTIRSLKLVNAAVQEFGNCPLHITLVHATEPDDSISGLLMLHKRQPLHQLYTEEFREACEVLKNKFASSVKSIKVELYYGSGRGYCRNFLEARKIDAVLLPEDFTLGMPSRYSRDIQPDLKKSGYPVFYAGINTKAQTDLTEETSPSLSELLHA